MHSRSRLASLDALRGLAAVAVAIYHYYLAEHIALPFNFDFGHTAVCVFFVLSGFVIVQAIETRSLTAFASGRFWRLYPTHTATLLLTLGLLIATAQPQAYLPSVWTSLASVSLVPSLFGVKPLVIGSWSLEIEMAWYAVAVVVWRLHMDWRLVGAAFVTLSLTGMPLAQYLVLMVIGVLCYEAHNGRSSWGWVFLLSGLYVLVAPVTRSIAPLFFLIALLWPKAIPQPLLWLGQRSYSLYLTHGICFSLARLAGNGWIFVMVWSALSLLVAHLLYEVVERPFIRLGRSMPVGKRTMVEIHLARAGSGDGH